MKTGIVESKFVFSNFRLDGKFHLSEGLEVRKSIHQSPYGCRLIKDVTSDIYCPGIFRRNYTSSGIPFLGGGDIQKADYDSGKYLRERTTPNNEILKIKKGWTLVTCGGTIGDTVFANNMLAKCWISQHVMRVIPSSIKEGMLFAYLASKYGHMLLTTNTYGSVIPTLNASNIASLPIPIFPEIFQKEVDDLIQESARLREEAMEELYEAVSLFESEIGPSKVILKHNCASIKSTAISSMFRRFDSQYQIGKSQISKYHKSVKIGSIATKIYIGNRSKRNYVSEGVPFLSSSDMMLANPLRSCKYISKKSPSLSEMKVKNRDILISRSGTVGNTIIVGNNLSGVAVSEHAMRLVIDSTKISPEYVFAYFMTQHGHDALQILPYGSVIITLGEEFLADVDLPIIETEIMDKISHLVSNYIKLQDDSVNKENLAISMVEKEIEKWN